MPLVVHYLVEKNNILYVTTTVWQLSQFFVLHSLLGKLCLPFQVVIVSFLVDCLSLKTLYYFAAIKTYCHQVNSAIFYIALLSFTIVKEIFSSFWLWSCSLCHYHQMKKMGNIGPIEKPSSFLTTPNFLKRSHCIKETRWKETIGNMKKKWRIFNRDSLFQLLVNHLLLMQLQATPLTLNFGPNIILGHTVPNATASQPTHYLIHFLKGKRMHTQNHVHVRVIDI